MRKYFGATVTALVYGLVVPTISVVIVLGVLPLSSLTVPLDGRSQLTTTLSPMASTSTAECQ